MTGEARYKQLTERTNPGDELVAREIKWGVRQSDGLTDIQAHLLTLQLASEGNVLEIGVRQGTSTAALLYGIEKRGGHLYSVDTQACPIALRLFAGHPNWTFLQLDSRDADAVKASINKNLNLVFIDGDHSFEGVLSDLRNYAPLAPLVMLHDAANNSALGVPQAISAYLDQPDCRHKKCVIYSESHGLAVLS